MTRLPPHSRNQTRRSPPRDPNEGAWLLGQRESVRRLPPRYRRGRPVQAGRQVSEEDLGRLGVDRPGRFQRLKVRWRGSLGTVCSPDVDKDRSGLGHLF